MKNPQRTKTQTTILEATKTLLVTKKYSEITVQEIIKKANVSRSTFYTYFQTKEDILLDLCQTLFHHIFYEVLEKETYHSLSHFKEEQAQFITHMLYHLKQNKEIVTNLAYSEKGQRVFQHFKELLEDTVVTSFMNSVSDDKFTMPKPFLISHISSSFLNMIYWWIKEDFTSTPEEMTIYFGKVINPIFVKSRIK